MNLIGILTIISQSLHLPYFHSPHHSPHTLSTVPNVWQRGPGSVGEDVLEEIAQLARRVSAVYCVCRS